MDQSRSDGCDAKSALAQGRARYGHYRRLGNLDSHGQTHESLRFDDRPRAKSRQQIEREITGDTTDAMGVFKHWVKSNSRASAVYRKPEFAIAIRRSIRPAAPGGATSISFRVESRSKTSKRRSASENWHSANHAKYIERPDATVDLGLEITPATASNYIERETAVANIADDEKAIFSNISADDPVERACFWRQVEAYETEGGENVLTIDMAAAGSIAQLVAADCECPAKLRIAIDNASPKDTVKFSGGDNVQLRSVFERHGWSKPPPGSRRRKKKKKNGHRNPPNGQATPGIKFKDARAGVTQIQGNGELPAELSLAGKVRIAERVHDWFDGRNLPVTVVVHKPDHRNNEKNWHFHFAAYDRPCRRFSNTPDWLPDLHEDATPAEKKEHQKLKGRLGRAELDQFEGEWDFAVPCTYKTASRNTRTTFPFGQNKDRYINHEDFPENFRKIVVALCNEELEREGHQRRYDHREYSLMGIDKQADEHLDTAANQLEKFGVVTELGAANEERQWAFVIATLDRQHADRAAKIEADWRTISQPTNADDSQPLSTAAEQWRALLNTANDNLRAEQELSQLIERAKSRATMTAETCCKHLAAIEAGTASKAETRDREAYENRLQLAKDHLAGVDRQFHQQVEDIAQLRKQRDLALARAHSIFALIEAEQRQAGTSQVPKAPRSNLSSHDSPRTKAGEQSAHEADAIEANRRRAINRLAAFAEKFPERVTVLSTSDGPTHLHLDRAPPDLMSLAKIYGSDEQLLAKLRLSGVTTRPNETASAEALKKKTSARQDPSMELSSTDNVELLLSRFRDAESDEDRRKAAVQIRANPQALQLMNRSEDAAWKAEQLRFANLQQATLGRGIVRG